MIATLWGFYGLLGVVDKSRLLFLLLPIALAAVGVALVGFPRRASIILLGLASLPFFTALAVLLS